MGADDPVLSKYSKRIIDRLKRGGLKDGYDPYNDRDLDGVCGTISTNSNVGQIGVFIVWIATRFGTSQKTDSRRSSNAEGSTRLKR